MRYPDPDDAFDRLKPLYPSLYQALEYGTDSARDMFESRGLEHDPLVFAAVARSHAISVLEAEAAGLSGFVRTPLTNSGIQFAFAGFDVRVWKTTDGELPSASSTAKQRFVHQLPLGPGFMGESAGEPAGGNLVVQWEYDRVTGTVHLTLVCPKPGDLGPESVDAFWSRPIPHPAEDAGAQPMSMPPASDGDGDDLDFIRPKDGGLAAESS